MKPMNMEESFATMRRQSTDLVGKYAQAFVDSEGVDNFYEPRIDELIKEAKVVEQGLLAQIDSFRQRLHSITETLKSAAH